MDMYIHADISVPAMLLTIRQIRLILRISHIAFTMI